MSRDSDLGWAAGLLDGEGMICLVTSKPSVHGHRRYVLQVQVTNTYLPALERFKAIVGPGRVRAATNSSKDEARYKPLWDWEATARAAEEVLTLLLPYLVIKHEQAELGIRSRHYVHKKRAVPRWQAPNTEQLEWFKRQISELKHQRFEWPEPAR